MSYINTDFIKRFKAKNLKYHQTSDGVAYVCELYIGTKKIAFVENHGTGGDSMVDFFNNDGSPKVQHINSDTKRTFNNLVKKHNAKQILTDCYNDNVRFNTQWKPEDFNEENILSTIVEDFIQLDSYKKDISKYQTKSICFGVPGSPNFMTVGWKKSISTLCKSKFNNGHGKDIVQKKIDEIKKEIKGTDQVILNTNLKRLGLKV